MDEQIARIMREHRCQRWEALRIWEGMNGGDVVLIVDGKRVSVAEWERLQREADSDHQTEGHQRRSLKARCGASEWHLRAFRRWW